MFTRAKSLVSVGFEIIQETMGLLIFLLHELQLRFKMTTKYIFLFFFPCSNAINKYSLSASFLSSSSIPFNSLCISVCMDVFVNRSLPIFVRAVIFLAVSE